MPEEKLTAELCTNLQAKPKTNHSQKISKIVSTITHHNKCSDVTGPIIEQPIPKLYLSITDGDAWYALIEVTIRIFSKRCKPKSSNQSIAKFISRKNY